MIARMDVDEAMVRRQIVGGLLGELAERALRDMPSPVGLQDNLPELADVARRHGGQNLRFVAFDVI